MKTTIKIILFIALITALCGCTVKADASTITDKEPANTKTLSDSTNEDVEDNATTSDSDKTNQDKATDAEPSPKCTASPAPTSDATDTDNPAPTKSDSEPAPTPESNPEPEPSATSVPTPEPNPEPEPSATPAPTPVPPTETLSAPSISISPTDTTRDPITVTISKPEGATMVKYQIDKLGYSVYNGPFTVDFNCKITAIAGNMTQVSEYETRNITNFDSSPEPTPELTVASAGSSYMKAVANAINAAKEAAGKPAATASYGGQIQTDAENILLGTQSCPSGLANWCRGSYSGTSAGNKLASGNLMDASNINIGAAKSSTGEYCICVAYW